jgi:hypothetical protein
LFLLRHVRAEMAGHPHGQGMVGRAADVALGIGIHAAAGAGGQAGVRGVRSLRGWVRSRTDPPPWERLEKAAENSAQVHGKPRPGWDSILESSADSVGLRLSPLPDTRAGDGSQAASQGSSGEPVASVVQAARRGEPVPSRPRAHPVESGQGAAADKRSVVSPMAEAARGGESSDVNQIPAPPPEDSEPTTVDPITDTEAGDPPQR